MKERGLLKTIKSFDYVINVISISIYILILTIFIAMDKGIMAVNYVMLIITALYFLFFVIFSDEGEQTKRKKTIKTGKLFYKIFKNLVLIINGFMAITTIYIASLEQGFAATFGAIVVICNFVISIISLIVKLIIVKNIKLKRESKQISLGYKRNYNLKPQPPTTLLDDLDDEDNINININIKKNNKDNFNDTI